MDAGRNTSAYAARNSDYVLGVTEEAVRLAQAATPAGGVAPPVRPYAWSFYHDGVAPLLPADLASELADPVTVGADGVVLWGDPPAFGHAPLFAAYLNATLGPYVRGLVTSECECGAKYCSGHGACTGTNSTPPCRCFPGFSGPNCAT
jgi:hypothetical protein